MLTGNQYCQLISDYLLTPAYCLPQPINLKSSRETRELDHLLAMRFKWWDVVLSGKQEETIQSPGQTDLFGQSEETNPP